MYELARTLFETDFRVRVKTSGNLVHVTIW